MPGVDGVGSCRVVPRTNMANVDAVCEWKLLDLLCWLPQS